MLDFPRWKVWSIILVLLVGILLAIPSLMPEKTAANLGIGGAPRINLGLDLSGGSHLLLEAQTQDVAKTKIDAMEDAVRTAMRRRSVSSSKRRSVSMPASSCTRRSRARTRATTSRGLKGLQT